MRKKKYKTKKINFTEKIPNKKFDIIIISEVLEHLDNPEKVLFQLKHKLKKDGLILGSIPMDMVLLKLRNSLYINFLSMIF